MLNNIALRIAGGSNTSLLIAIISLLAERSSGHAIVHEFRQALLYDGKMLQLIFYV